MSDNNTNHVASNYSEAIDGNISKWREKYIKWADKHKLPTHASNCTLTVTNWLNPGHPILKAQSIIDNPSKYGYTQISEELLIPRDVVIATNPLNGTNHTMMIDGFSNGELKHTFNGKQYLLPDDHPIVKYSRGRTSDDYLRRIGLMEYIDNSEGKTDLKYYRFNGNDIQGLLPEITITPNGAILPLNLNVQYINWK